MARVEGGSTVAQPIAAGLGVDIVPEEIAGHRSVRNVLELPADDRGAFATGTRDEVPYAQMRLKRRLKLQGR